MILLLWLYWMILSNCYFGWNAVPQSHAELASSAFSIFLLALAFSTRKR